MLTGIITPEHRFGIAMEYNINPGSDAATSIGGFDMIFTIWQFLRNQEAERARNVEREEERKEREEMMAMLREEQQRNQELHARVMELSELAIQRANGSRSNGDTESVRGE